MQIVEFCIPNFFSAHRDIILLCGKGHVMTSIIGNRSSHVIIATF
jgi:hypothetical protein